MEGGDGRGGFLPHHGVKSSVRYRRGMRHHHRIFKEGNVKRSLILLLILSLVLPVLFLGCSGDDGSTGAAGAPGAPGTPGPPGPGVAASPESCGVCHSSVESIHAATGVASVSNVAVAAGASLVFTFDIKVDGVANNSFTLRRAYVNWDNTARQTGSLITSFQRDTLYSTSATTPVDVGLLFSKVNGTYTVTVPTAFQIDNSTYLFQLESAASTERPVVVAHWPVTETHLRNLVTNDGCASCHGPYPAWSKKFDHYAVGGSECQICHSRYNNPTAFISKNAAGAFVTTDNVFGTNLTEYVHGIHNSHNMPDGVYYRTSEPDDAPYSTEDRYSIGYPSDMRNCKVCHTTPAQQTAIAAAPVSYYLCMTCHNNWDGFVHLHDAANGSYKAGDNIFAADNFHRGATTSTNCMSCHSAISTLDEVSDFHNDFQSVDSHYNSFYRGTDISFDNPDNVTFAIAGLTKAGDNVTFTWTAKKGSPGAPVNPCDNNLALGPSFRGLGAYLAYAKGDDWVNENVGSSPGQPAGSRPLFPTATSTNHLSTTCDNTTKVDTTRGLVVDPDANAYAVKALLAIGGKPVNRGTFTIGSTLTPKDYFIRFPSPIYAFNLATGAAINPDRRFAVANAKCLACHRGTLYQHGGDRVDNEQLCVVCHNPSSSDRNNRAFFKILNADNTVDTNSTYDGKVAETYDMRYMIHAIHGAEKRTNPLVIYRTRGIYAFVPPVYDIVDTGTDNVRVEIGYPKPTGWPATESTTLQFPIFGSDNNSTQIHNWIVVHYPKPASDCLACHNAGLFEAPDQTKAVALTVDSGTSNLDQSDDTVIGPAAGACTACHATSAVRSHANQFGYRTNVTKDELLVLAQP